MSRTVDTN